MASSLAGRLTHYLLKTVLKKYINNCSIVITGNLLARSIVGIFFSINNYLGSRENRILPNSCGGKLRGRGLVNVGHAPSRKKIKLTH
jgi:hypothetical protein